MIKDDPRFNPIAAEEALDIKKLLNSNLEPDKIVT